MKIVEHLGQRTKRPFGDGPEIFSDVPQSVQVTRLSDMVHSPGWEDYGARFKSNFRAREMQAELSVRLHSVFPPRPLPACGRVTGVPRAATPSALPESPGPSAARLAFPEGTPVRY